MKNWIIIISLTFMWMGCKNNQPRSKARISSITESVYASGIVKAQKQYNVFATVNGILREIYVTEGDRVKKGDPLFLIENQSTSLNTDNARLALELSAQNAKSNSNRLRELEVAVSLAKEKLQNDSIMYFRQKTLWSQNVGTKVDLEQRQLAYRSSGTNYISALSRYRQAKSQLNTEYQQAKNNLKISKDIESNYIIRSETDGLVYDILKEQGELITTQGPIAVLGKSENFILELQVDEYDIVKTRIKQKVLVSMDSYKGKIFNAEISKIYPIMNERSRTFTVEAIFTDQPAELYPNLTLEANIIIQTKQNALVIPREYLIDDQFVFTDEDKKIKSKVKTGLMDYKYVEIQSGLDSNQYVYKP